MVGEVFRLNVSFVCFLGPEECFSGESWDRSSNSSEHDLCQNLYVFGPGIVLLVLYVTIFVVHNETAVTLILLCESNSSRLNKI